MAANAIKTICKDCTSGVAERDQLVRALLAAAHGKTFDGKQHVIDALAQLCVVKENESPISPSLSEDVITALLVEARKQDMVYKKHAITSLGVALAAIDVDRFNQVYDIVKVILSKNELSMGKESDEEDDEGARKRREQLTSLKESAYDLLANAWPNNAHTQEKYQEVFFEHCATSYPNSSRSTQLSILKAMNRVLDRLAVLNASPMDVDNVDVAAKDKAIAAILGHVTGVIDYTLKNSNQMRHRRDALNILELLVKKFKDLNRVEEVNKLKTLYQLYAQDLSKDSSHEIRTKIDAIKVQFK